MQLLHPVFLRRGIGQYLNDQLAVQDTLDTAFISRAHLITDNTDVRKVVPVERADVNGNVTIKYRAPGIRFDKRIVSILFSAIVGDLTTGHAVDLPIVEFILPLRALAECEILLYGILSVDQVFGSHGMVLSFKSMVF